MKVDRLMLLVPPRHGKSELASRRFPAFYLGRHPERQFISASASMSLAEDFGRDVRNVMASEEYRQVFTTRLADDSQAKGRWNTAQGGSYYAVGVGTNVMGRGAHVFLIDDPFGTMADARSETERKNVWDWYRGTVYNRLEKAGAIVLINHRMHEDDLTGKLLAEQAAGGDKWTVVELAIDEHCNRKVRHRGPGANSAQHQRDARQRPRAGWMARPRTAAQGAQQHLRVCYALLRLGR